MPATPRPDNDAFHSSSRTGRPYRDRRLHRDRQPGSGLSFIAEFEALIFSAIAVRPDSFPARPDLGEGLRVARHHRYLVFFTHNAERIEVLRILHAARELQSLLN
ncbi:type II toxin-antitoxin system RelE/ParE family toxin [Ochrobactrum sp. AN78]|uniref:type II toxin-antitoxin system RelE/ParE family toxin n=1 Tax=Ochrobactrum sp. AN78 TaxID=3039853 RepID=UPI002989ABA2|nr:type II toxin-antitoxin system RelE/ParE family toxin [Ochrobactrum sp. AN78]MDH7792269.1 plasmid stabilization system protein ParE [Ochrobactrum sp. AN78]